MIYPPVCLARRDQTIDGLIELGGLFHVATCVAPAKDDADRTFEEESRRHNQRTLSASNGLAFDASAR